MLLKIYHNGKEDVIVHSNSLSESETTQSAESSLSVTLLCQQINLNHAMQFIRFHLNVITDKCFTVKTEFTEIPKNRYISRFYLFIYLSIDFRIKPCYNQSVIDLLFQIILIF